MKKLSLDLDELCVESFATSPDHQKFRGTIKAFVTTDDLLEPDAGWTRGFSCLATCPMNHTCGFGYSCGGGTCDYTCPASCLGGSCYESCNGTCYVETCNDTCQHSCAPKICF